MIRVAVTKHLCGAHGDFEMNLDLSVAARTIVAVTGASGSGKTTLLRMIAGLTRPDSGAITVDEEAWYDGARGICCPPQARRIGFVFQDAALFPTMTVRQNIAYAAEREGLVDDLIGVMELGNLADRLPATLSGGQKQRVALARAMAREPEILLLDEPFSALDHAITVKLHQALREVHRRYPVTTVLVSHDIAEICTLASRMIRLEHGRVAQDGPPHQLLTERETSHKFSFVGEIIDIRKSDIVYVVLIAAGNTVSEVVLTADDVRDLRPGDTVMAAAKGFQPVVKKIVR